MRGTQGGSERLVKAVYWLATIGVVTTVSCAVFYFAWFRHLSDRPSDWGVFGDFLSGAAGTVLAIATLIAVVINMQIQADELRATKTLLRRQSFEQTFFQLLDHFRELAGKMEDKPVLAGVVANVNSMVRVKGTTPSLRHDFALRVYGQEREANAAWLGPYFRQLFLLLRFVEDYSERDEVRERYAGIVRSQLSINEVQVLLLEHAYGTHRDPEGGRLLSRYRMMAYINELEAKPPWLDDALQLLGGRQFGRDAVELTPETGVLSMTGYAPTVSVGPIKPGE